MDAPSKPFINIVLIQPVGYTHALALLEVAEYFQFKLEALGYETRLVKNRFDHGAINLVLAGHLLKSTEGIPPRTIIFNSEQFGEDNSWTKNHFYISLLQKYYVWDYSELNLKALKMPQASLVDIVYESRLDRLRKDAPKEIDLLFYGSMNPRREQILKQLLAKGLKVKLIFNLYGAERDWYLERSRAVLNLHYYDAQVFQQVRSFYPMINGIPVVSEDYPLESAPKIYQEAVFKPNGPNFVGYVVEILRHTKAFEEESRSKLQKFKEASVESGIELAVNNAIAFFDKSAPSKGRMHATYTKLNLGCGLDYRQGYLNLDANPDVVPDLVLEISKPMVLPCHMKDWSGADLMLLAEQFEEIVAQHVFEQVSDLKQAMTNCLMLLKEGGKLKITVSYDLSSTVYSDPNNKRSFNQSSWQTYTERFWQLGWFDNKFELVDQSLKPSELGKKLLAENKPQAEVLVTPRAIDSMTVTLVKRKTTPEERTKARAFLPTLTQ